MDIIPGEHRIMWSCRHGHDTHTSKLEAEQCEILVLLTQYTPTRKIIEIRQPGATRISSSSSKVLDTKKIECSTDEAVQIYFQLQVLLLSTGAI